MANSAFSGNSSELGTNINAASSGRGSTVKGPKGSVQRAALKRITGAAAVGAVVDGEDETRMFNPGSMKRPNLHPNNKKSQRVPHVIPTPKANF